MTTTKPSIQSQTEIICTPEYNMFSMAHESQKSHSLKSHRLYRLFLLFLRFWDILELAALWRASIIQSSQKGSQYGAIACLWEIFKINYGSFMTLSTFCLTSVSFLWPFYIMAVKTLADPTDIGQKILPYILITWILTKTINCIAYMTKLYHKSPGELHIYYKKYLLWIPRERKLICITPGSTNI